MSSLKSRLLVSVVGVPLLLWVVLAAPVVVVAAALAALAAIGAYEMLKCVGAGKTFLQYWSVACAALTVLACGYAQEYVRVLWVVYLMAAFLYAVLKAGEIRCVQTLAGMFSVAALSYSFAGFLRMEAAGLHRAYLLLPFILSFACDTFAYFVGCSIGKHKLAPKVSPKKSVEGAIGGLAGNVVCGLLFAFVMNRWFDGSAVYGAMILMSLACGVVAQIGDLSFSLIKREFGIKDYGKLFLAHGGVLDRFDSVLFVTPIIEIILNFVR